MGAPRRPKPFVKPGARPKPPAHSPRPNPLQYVPYMREQLAPMLGVVQDTQRDVRGLAQANLGPATAALMMARNDVKGQLNQWMAPVNTVLQGVKADVTGQAMDQIGNVIALAQSATPEFPGIDQIAQRMYPQSAQLFGQTPGNPQELQCEAFVAQQAEKMLASCAAQFPLGGQEYADCSNRVQQAVIQALNNCAAIAGQGGSGGGVRPPPGHQPPPKPKPQPAPMPPAPVPPKPAPHPAPVPAPTPSPGPSPTPTGPSGGGHGGSGGQPVGILPEPGLIGVCGSPGLPACSPTWLNGGIYGPAGWYVETPTGIWIPVTPAPPDYTGPTIPAVPTPLQDWPTVTTETSSSVPGPDSSTGPTSSPPSSTPPKPACAPDIIAAALHQASEDSSPETAAMIVSAQYQLDIKYNPGGFPCDTGYTPVSTQWIMTNTVENFCIKCPPQTGPTTTTPPGQCCPVNVTVNVPPCPTPASQVPPKPPGPPVPPAPIPAALNLQEQAAQGGNCIPPAFALAGWNTPTFISSLLGLRDGNGALNEVGGPDANSNFVFVVINALLDGVRGLTDNLGQVITKLIPSSGCVDPNYVALQITRTVTDLIEKYIGGGLDGIQAKATQQAHNLCPSMLPSPDNAIEAFLTNQIDRATALCWARAGNQTQDEWDKMIDARQTRLNALDLIACWKRQFIQEGVLNRELRELGFTDDQYVDLMKKLADQIPPASDLVSFMVRDVEDPNIVGPFGLDDDFNLKFQGKVKEWADNQGVTEEYMKRIWRAHWSIPSPTQLFEFWHKLRNNPKYAPAQTLYDDIVTALKQQDILPKWVPYYLDSSYRVPTRVDVRRMFNNGNLNREQVRVIYTQGGYNDEAAEALTQFAEAEKKKAWKKNPYVAKYVKGLVTQNELTNILNALGVDDDTIAEIIKTANFEIVINKRDVCHKAWKKRYLNGEIRLDEAITLLIGDGLDNQTAQTIAAGWQCAKTNRSKTIPAATACKLFSDGIIAADDYYNRLVNIGYQPADALALVTDCEQQALRKRNAADERALAKQAAAQQKAINQARQSVRRQQQATQQQRAALSKARSISKKRRDAVLEGAFNYAKHSGEMPGVAVELVNNMVETVRSRTGATYDVVVQALPKVSGVKSVKTPDDLLSSWVGAIQNLGPAAGDPSTPVSDFLPVPPSLL